MKKTKFLIKYSKQKESNIAKFKKNLKVINTKTNTLVDMKHDYLQVSKDNYLWFVYNQKLLEEKMAKNGDCVAIFLTLTLDSEFHQYSSHTKSFNPNFKKENTINKGYQLLNSSFRTIYKNFRINRKVEKVFFSKAIEPHKDLTCHLHAIIYVNKEYLENFKNHILNTIKKNQLGRHDFEVIKDISRSTSYLLKYIQKNTNPKNESDYHFFNGWKKINKIRVFTYSNLELERFIFRKVNNVLRLTKDLKAINPILEVLAKCDITINTQDKDTKAIKTKTYKNDDAKYKVVINRTRTIYSSVLSFSKFEITNALKKYKVAISLDNIKEFTRFLLKEKNIYDKNLIIDVCFEYYKNYEEYFNSINSESWYCIFKTLNLEKKYNYKINTFNITDTKTNKKLYSKSDFMMLEDFNDKNNIEQTIVHGKLEYLRKYLDYERI